VALFHYLSSLIMLGLMTTSPPDNTVIPNNVRGAPVNLRRALLSMFCATLSSQTSAACYRAMRWCTSVFGEIPISTIASSASTPEEVRTRRIGRGKSNVPFELFMFLAAERYLP
jgi:hypothetical protein